LRLLADTNIILDSLQKRTPFDRFSDEILLRAEKGEFELFLTANSMSDIFYVYSKARDNASAKSALRYLLDTYKIVSISDEDCKAALALPIDDFEDALVIVCAQNIQADFVVTRDELFLKSNIINTIHPQKLLERE
jgi:predicted nucleic acid-binding protein